MRMPETLARAVEQEILRLAPGNLRPAVEELSRRYREGIGVPMQTAAQRAAYLVTRLPATYAAVTAVLEELRRRAPNFSPTSLFDLGAGPGTAAWAACESFESLRRITLVERDAAMAETGRELAMHSSCSALRAAEWVGGDLASYEGERCELVVMSYVVGELPAAQRVMAVQRAWNAAGQAMVIIEPGTPAGFSRVIEARLRLIALGGNVAAPCPHQQVCPMARRSAGARPEWCHFVQRLERTALHRRLKNGELGHEDEKFSYVVAMREPVQRAEARIVRHPMQSKGLVKLELCTLEGIEQRLVTKSQGETYKEARKAKWGEEWAR